MTVFWTPQAIQSFEENIDWLEQHWTNREIENFINETDAIIERIKQNPYIFAASENESSIRKGLINNIVSVFYRVRHAQNEIDILLSWNGRQNPKKLNFFS